MNEITDDRFQFFGLEIELWRIGSSPPAPKFNMVSRPNDWVRSVSEMAHADSENMTPWKQLQKAFWADLMKRLEVRQSPVRTKKPQPQGWMGFSIGRSDFSLDSMLHSREKWIGVDLVMVGPNATAHFQLLEQQRKEIEGELGELEWRALPGKKSSTIRLRRQSSDPTQQEDWSNQIDWLVSTLEKFNKTFRPRLKSLDASDWRPEDDGTDE